jgi:hypothetical protein
VCHDVDAYVGLFDWPRPPQDIGFDWTVKKLFPIKWQLIYVKNIDYNTKDYEKGGKMSNFKMNKFLVGPEME